VGRINLWEFPSFGKKQRRIKPNSLRFHFCSHTNHSHVHQTKTHSKFPILSKATCLYLHKRTAKLSVINFCMRQRHKTNFTFFPKSMEISTNLPSGYHKKQHSSKSENLLWYLIHLFSNLTATSNHQRFPTKPSQHLQLFSRLKLYRFRNSGMFFSECFADNFWKRSSKFSPKNLGFKVKTSWPFRACCEDSCQAIWLGWKPRCECF